MNSQGIVQRSSPHANQPLQCLFSQIRSVPGLFTDFPKVLNAFSQWVRLNLTSMAVKIFLFSNLSGLRTITSGADSIKGRMCSLDLAKILCIFGIFLAATHYNHIWSRSNNEMLLVLKGIQCLDGQERMEESEGPLKPVATAQHMSIKGLGASCPISWQNAQRCPRTCQIKQSPCMRTIQQQLAVECTCKGLIRVFHSIRTYFRVEACSARHHQKSQWMKEVEWNGVHGFVHEHNREIFLTLFNP